MKKIVLFFSLLIVSISVVGQITREVLLRDSLKKSPIIGVTAFDKSGNRVAESDEKGVINIAWTDSEQNYTLRHMAYEDYHLIIKKGDTSVKFALYLIPVTEAIEEIIINTGYQLIPKERATGSFATVSNSKLQERIEGNILERLEGIAPGLQFDKRDGNAKLNIRGINSLSSGGISPLIIVDNFPYEGDLSTINPNDVESVSLLRDAAATSIWGVRAGNGVIVINMKKPKESQRINFISNIGFTAKPDLKYYQAMSSNDFIDLEMELYDKGFYRSLLTNKNAKSFVFSPVVSALYDLERGYLAADEVQDRIGSYRHKDYRNDLLKYFYRTGIAQQYSVSTSKVGERYGIRMSLGYDDNLNVEKSNEANRLNFLSTAYLLPFKNVRLEVATSFVNRKNDSSLGFPNYPMSPSGNKTNLYPYAELIAENGEPMYIPYKYNYNYVDTVGQGRLLDWRYSPLADIDKSKAAVADRYIAISPTLQITPMQGVSLSLLYNYENQNYQISNHYTSESFYARDLLNRYTEVLDDKIVNNIPKGDIIQFSSNQLVSHKVRLQSAIDKRWKDKHAFNAVIGGEVSSRKSVSRMMREYGYDPERLTTQPVNYTDLFPIYDGLARNTSIPYNNGIAEMLSRYVSLYANGSYSYKNKYTVSLSGRRDASNVFGVRANKLWNPLWSLGGAWTIAKEDWFPAKSLINDLKLRFTMGHSGNSGRLANTDVIISFQSADQYYNKPYARIIRPPNPDLKWEDVAMRNLGLDLGLFNNRLIANVDFFMKKSTDLISEDPINPTVGFSTVNRNVAEIKGRGVDVQLNSNLAWDKWKWSSSLFLSYTKDQVTKFKGDRYSSITYASRGGTSISPLIDYVMYPVFSYKSAGLNPENGNPRGYLNGEASENYAQIFRDSLEALNYHGSALPLGHGAFSNSITYKQLTLSFTVSFKFASYFMKPSISYYGLYNNWETHKDYEKRWQKPGDERLTTVPSLPYPANQSRDNFYAYSEANVEKGDLLRLQNIKLQYSLSKSQSKYMKVENVQVYASANNLGMLWSASKSGYDPDFTYLPTARSFNIGLNLLF